MNIAIIKKKKKEEYRVQWIGNVKRVRLESYSSRKGCESLLHYYIKSNFSNAYLNINRMEKLTIFTKITVGRGFDFFSQEMEKAKRKNNLI